MVAPNKRKGVTTVLSKRKSGGGASRTEEVMYNALKTRSSKRIAKAEANVPKEVAGKVESFMTVGIGMIFSPN